MRSSFMKGILASIMGAGTVLTLSAIAYGQAAPAPAPQAQRGGAQAGGGVADQGAHTSALAGKSSRLWPHLRLRASAGRRTDADAPDAPLEGGKVSEVVVIGDRAFGDEDERPRSWTRALARTARVGYLGARFVREARGYVFLDAEVVPRLNSAETLDAARRYLLSGAHRALG